MCVCVCVCVCVLVIYCCITDHFRSWWLKTRTIPFAHESAVWTASAGVACFCSLVSVAFTGITGKARNSKNPASLSLSSFGPRASLCGLSTRPLQQDSLRIVGLTSWQLGSKNKCSKRDPGKSQMASYYYPGLRVWERHFHHILLVKQVTKASPYSTIFF